MTIGAARGARLIVASALLVAGAAGLAGCTGFPVAPGSSEGGSPSGGPSPGAGRSDAGDRPASVDAATSLDDVAWVAEMAAHHDQAVALAALADERAQDPEVIAGAATIAVAQAAEAGAMRAWLERRGVDGAHDAVPGGHGTMPGEISASAMDRVRALDGDAFDRLYLDLMIRHHEGAVEMSEQRLEASGDPAVARWARTIASSQAVEIDRLRSIAQRLGAGVPG
ncbi:DUF305 domain-containing protein [Agromyces sp. LHK192]|uniref:DUF305 domain-containing protein n=1 Tax=Agromyces sp. LHK192 TaxID=2498704 RepID=UPI0013E3041D|nr:DUF305 domain-containing protein [Agromyces sp. LHK192]